MAVEGDLRRRRELGLESQKHRAHDADVDLVMNRAIFPPWGQGPLETVDC